MNPRTLAPLAALVALLASAAPLHADRLTDLRATLARLKAETPVKAQLAVRSVEKNSGDDEAKTSTGEATVIAEHGREGLRLSWPAQQVAEARKAARQKAANPDAKEEKGVELGAIDADDALKYLDAAEPLALALEGATLAEDKVEARAGKPTRVLVVKPRDGLSASDRKSLKSREDVLKVWLDEAGNPIAADRSTKLKFSKLLIAITISVRESRAFARVGDRLLVTSAIEESSGSGLGQTGETRKTVRVTVLG